MLGWKEIGGGTEFFLACSHKGEQSQGDLKFYLVLKKKTSCILFYSHIYIFFYIFFVVLNILKVAKSCCETKELKENQNSIKPFSQPLSRDFTRFFQHSFTHTYLILVIVQLKTRSHIFLHCNVMCAAVFLIFMFSHFNVETSTFPTRFEIAFYRKTFSGAREFNKNLNHIS